MLVYLLPKKYSHLNELNKLLNKGNEMIPTNKTQQFSCSPQINYNQRYGNRRLYEKENLLARIDQIFVLSNPNKNQSFNLCQQIKKCKDLEQSISIIQENNVGVDEYIATQL
jgi:hypothetical protein